MKATQLAQRKDFDKRKVSIQGIKKKVIVAVARTKADRHGAC